MKKIHQMLCCTAVLAMMCSCGNGNKFTIEGQGFDGMEGKTVYLTNMCDTASAADSAVVSGGRFVLRGEAAEPWVGLITGKNYAISLAVEPGTIGLRPDSLWGTPLNERDYAFSKSLMAQLEGLQAEMQSWALLYETADAAQRDEAGRMLDSLGNEGNRRIKEAFWKVYADNKDNPLGALALEALVQTEEMGFGQLDSLMAEASTVVAKYRPLIEAHKQLRKAEATSTGHPYTDISGMWRDADGTLTPGRLSDRAQGHLTLVDFFASWCGPCRQEIQNNIKGLHEKYRNKGLVVVGLNVWERGDAAKRAEALKKTIDDLGIGYPILVDSTTDATDAYGVQGIPQIILIGKDGTILARDLRGKEIEEAVRKAIDN